MQKKKTAIITARMTPQTKAEIQHRAKQAGMTVTDYLVTCALGKEIIQVNGLDEILSELKAQGRNLNQLTTLANMGRIQFLRSDELIDRYADLYQRMTGIARGDGSGDLHSGAKQEANSRNDGRRDEVCSPEEENSAG